MSETSTTSVPRGRGDELLSLLAERIGARLSASTVFRTPVERDGVTVVPVAVARFGIGAGSGSDPSKGRRARAAEEEASSRRPATSSSRTAGADSCRSFTRPGCSRSCSGRSSPRS